MAFHLVDMETWPRAQQYGFFMRYMRIVHSTTVNMDIGHLKEELKKRNLKLTPAMMYLVTRVANAHQEFRYALDEQGRLGYFDRFDPWFPLFHPETENLSLVWAEYSDDFMTFYNDYIRVAEAYQSSAELLPMGPPPPNTFCVTMMKWISFTSVNFNVYQMGSQSCGNFHTLSCTFGKYFTQEGKLLMPMALEMHHAVCDGFHSARMFQEVQALCDRCEDWLPSA